MGSGLSSCTCGNDTVGVLPLSHRSSAKTHRNDSQRTISVSNTSRTTNKTVRSTNGSVKWEDWRSQEMQIIDYGDDSDSDDTLTEDDPDFEIEKNNLLSSHHAHGTKWMISSHAYNGPLGGTSPMPLVEDPRRLSIDGKPPTRPGSAHPNHRPRARHSPCSPPEQAILDGAMKEQLIAAANARFATVNGVRKQVTRYHHNGGMSNFLSVGNGSHGRYKQRKKGSATSQKSKNPEDGWKSLCDSNIPVDRTLPSAFSSRRSSLVSNAGSYVPIFNKNAPQSEYNKPNQRAPLPQHLNSVDQGSAVPPAANVDSGDSGYSGSEGMCQSYTESNLGGSTAHFKTNTRSFPDYYESDCDSLMTEELGSDIVEDYSGSSHSLNTLSSGKGTSIESHISPFQERSFYDEERKSHRPKAAGRHRSAPRYYCMDNN